MDTGLSFSEVTLAVSTESSTSGCAERLLMGENSTIYVRTGPASILTTYVPPPLVRTRCAVEQVQPQSMLARTGPTAATPKSSPIPTRVDGVGVASVAERLSESTAQPNASAV